MDNVTDAHVTGSDGHKSSYTKAFLSRAAAPADQKAIVRQGLAG